MDLLASQHQSKERTVPTDPVTAPPAPTPIPSFSEQLRAVLPEHHYSKIGPLGFGFLASWSSPTGIWHVSTEAQVMRSVPSVGITGPGVRVELDGGGHDIELAIGLLRTLGAIT